MNRSLRHSWIAVPPWIILGAVFILVPIFLFWTVQSIRKQKEGMTLLMLEKGAALIRSFEAGTRTGMMGMMGMRGGGGFQLQRLLTETAEQPDVVYLLVTDTEGTILAHSDQARVGQTYGKDLDLERISHSEKVEWRLVSALPGSETFEVFRRFAPIRIPGRGLYGKRMMERWPQEPSALKEWEGGRGMVIFLGLDMGPLDEARKRDMRQALITALVLLLIGFAGIVLLFLGQAYRSTRSSLTRIKAFSDKVVESMPIGLLALDPEGHIASLNQAAGHVLRLPGPILGRKAEEAIPPRLFEMIRELGSGKKVTAGELDCPVAGGGVVPLDVIVSTLEGEDGSFLGTILLFRDMTEVQDLRREVETSRRLASLGRLAAGIAHEIRNPLSSIKGFATYFKERYRDVPEDQSTAEIMVKEVDRLNRVITDLLEFARPMTIQKKPASLRALIQHSLNTIRQQALEKGIQIQAGLPADPTEIPMDPDKINQVLLNLYLNALEATAPGGTLSVELAHARDGKGIRIAVKDTGAGIRREDLAHVFDPYFTTRPSGTGLGLAIVHKIMESHRGEVRVESEPGRGTTVILSLPGPDE
jgi:two-component system, NtrC family, sensor histidine kinase HydH